MHRRQLLLLLLCALVLAAWVPRRGGRGGFAPAGSAAAPPAAIEFNGVDQRGVASGSVIPTTGPGVSISCWLYLYGTAPNSLSDIYAYVYGVGSETQPLVSRYWVLTVAPRSGVPTQLQVAVSVNGFSTGLNPVTTPTVNTWHHTLLTLNYTTGALNWYVDGSLVSTRSVAGAPLTLYSGPADFVLGANANAYYRHMRSHRLAIWHSVLGLTEAGQLAGGAVPTTVGSPAHYWPEEGGSTTLIPDAVGSADMTLENVTAFVAAP